MTTIMIMMMMSPPIYLKNAAALASKASRARINATIRRQTQSGYVSGSDLEWTLNNRISNDDYENVDDVDAAPINPRSSCRPGKPSSKIKDNEKTEKIMAKVQRKAVPLKERRAKKAKLNAVIDTAIAALNSMDSDISDAEVPALGDDEEWGIDLKPFATHHGETYYLYKQKQ